MAQLDSRTFRARLFAVAGLVALAATYLMPIIDADWNAWRYDHGHASLSTARAVGQHTHPWESSSETADRADAGFLYTAAGDSVPGITAIWTPSTAAFVTLLGERLVELTAITPPHFVAAGPLSPPPEVFLSRI